MANNKTLVLVLLTGVGLWLWSRREPIEAAPGAPVTPSQVKTEELVTDPVKITVALNALGVQAPATPEDVARTLSGIAAAGIDVSKGIPEAVFREYFQEPAAAAIGLTMAEVPAYAEVALEVNLRLGGSYVAGVLTPPKSWTGSVTEWSMYVQGVALIEYKRLKSLAKVGVTPVVTAPGVTRPVGVALPIAAEPIVPKPGVTRPVGVYLI